MKKIWLPAVLALYALPLFAQDDNTGTLLLIDARMNETRLMDSAKYFLNIRKLNDTTWRHDYYQLTGPRWRSETFKDEEATKPHGRFAFYNSQGYIDSVGDAINGKRHGSWGYYIPDGYSIKMIVYKEYDNGKLVKEKDYRIKSTEKKADDKNEYTTATFKGLRQFLEENLQFPKRALNMVLGDIVVVDFEVDGQGRVSDPVVMRSIEYSLDREAERVINLSSGRWTPGTENKKPVTTYHRQSISFAIVEEN